jgi:hypothetical protein
VIRRGKVELTVGLFTPRCTSALDGDLIQSTVHYERPVAFSRKLDDLARFAHFGSADPKVGPANDLDLAIQTEQMC